MMRSEIGGCAEHQNKDCRICGPTQRESLDDQKLKDGEQPAFPVSIPMFNEKGNIDNVALHPGLTIRDWFAGMALQGLYASGNFDGEPKIDDTVAQVAYEAADFMLVARKKNA